MRLYYNDPYLSKFEATALETRAEGCEIILDQSAFYPTSGGQPNDLGTINGVPVTDVREENAVVVHVTNGPVQPGPVLCEIDWTRRYDHMQQHTGQHLLSAVFVELFSAPTLSFHLGSNISTIEIGRPSLAETEIDLIEDRVNERVRQSLPVTITYSSAEDTEGLRKPSKRSGELRIIAIEGIDRSACGGTHVRSTAELAPIHIRRTEKIRGNTRIEFVCGIRAQRRSRQDYLVIAELARSLTSPLDDLPKHVSALRARFAELDRDRQRLSAAFARSEGAELHRTALADPDGIRRVFLAVGALDEALKAKLQAFAGEGKAVALASGTETPAVLIACSSDSGLNAGAILKQAFARAGGRGGGSETMAQGTLSDEKTVDLLKSLLGFVAAK